MTRCSQVAHGRDSHGIVADAIQHNSAVKLWTLHWERKDPPLNNRPKHSERGERCPTDWDDSGDLTPARRFQRGGRRPPSATHHRATNAPSLTAPTLRLCEKSWNRKSRQVVLAAFHSALIGRP